MTDMNEVNIRNLVRKDVVYYSCVRNISLTISISINYKRLPVVVEVSGFVFLLFVFGVCLLFRCGFLGGFWGGFFAVFFFFFFSFFFRGVFVCFLGGFVYLFVFRRGVGFF